MCVCIYVYIYTYIYIYIYIYRVNPLERARATLAHSLASSHSLALDRSLERARAG